MVANHKPGEDNQHSGVYVEVGPRGGAVINPRIVHIDQGDRLPPTQESGHLWQRRSGAKH
ncbi:YjzC family protein [Bifidobacterium vespertilionis]|uniref:YjzC family protein n=1 Tax=Bifidobacterium vespertilionis TaxID=2562524 RepID=UPI001BDBB54F|nr:YjzC family protein [Bifidobacterium vespertilionis]MBT1180090.1 YjzC family protein [Bifidobacterium vespertilionis]